MKRGGKFLVSTTAFAVAACGGEQGKLEIRSTPKPLAQIKRAVPERIAEARGQLALNNVALALTSFRIAAREDPNSIDALAGIADCYDRMGRFDLSRRYYESALAASLQLQGKSAEALSVREEISARMAAAGALESASMAEVAAPVVQLAAAESTPTPVKASPPAAAVVLQASAASVSPPEPKAVPTPLPKPEVRVAAAEPQV